MEHRPLIVATNRVFPETAELLSTVGAVMANPSDEPWTREEILRRSRDAEALMAFMTDRIDADFLTACPKLKIIAAALKGFDNIDVASAEKAGVWVSIVPDLLTAPTAELAIALMLALGRHVLASDRLIRAQGFSGWRPTFYGRGIAAATVGIIGCGAVGRAIARRLAGFDCRLLATDLALASGAQTSDELAEAVSFDRLIAESDFVVLALPLTATTKFIINRAVIARMKQGALLINPARGSLVDEAAVAEALEAGLLSGYAADVFQCEDWAQEDRPREIDARLTAPGAPTVLTSHIGSAVTDVRRAIERSAAQSIVEALSGQRPREAANFPKQGVPC